MTNSTEKKQAQEQPVGRYIPGDWYEAFDARLTALEGRAAPGDTQQELNAQRKLETLLVTLQEIAAERGLPGKEYPLGAIVSNLEQLERRIKFMNAGHERLESEIKSIVEEWRLDTIENSSLETIRTYIDWQNSQINGEADENAELKLEIVGLKAQLVAAEELNALRGPR